MKKNKDGDFDAGTYFWTLSRRGISFSRFLDGQLRKLLGPLMPKAHAGPPGVRGLWLWEAKEKLSSCIPKYALYMTLATKHPQ